MDWGNGFHNFQFINTQMNDCYTPEYIVDDTGQTLGLP